MELWMAIKPLTPQVPIRIY